MINELGERALRISKSKGYYDKESILELLAMIHTEVSEAIEADRKDNWVGKSNMDAVLKKESYDTFSLLFEKYVKNTFQDELADIMIRTISLAAHLEVDLEKHIEAKLRYNELNEDVKKY